MFELDDLSLLLLVAFMIELESRCKDSSTAAAVVSGLIDFIERRLYAVCDFPQRTVELHEEVEAE